MGSESIEYSMTDEPRHGGMNEAVYAKADDQMLYFEALGMQSYVREKAKKQIGILQAIEAKAHPVQNRRR
jgi:hypothetical protein